MSSWAWVAVSAASLVSSAPPEAAQPVQLAQASVPMAAAAAQSSTYSWDTYKLRLAGRARLQGVRQSTIQANVPNLDINDRAIQFERTEPVARSSGGVVGTLQPYLRVHVTRSLISRGQANYSDHYNGLRRLEARYGVDPAVLMS